MTTPEASRSETVRYGDEALERPAGGDTHQVADGGRPPLTTRQGVIVGDDQNTLTVGDRGPAALEDFHFRGKLFHFDHERIPERVVHARGFGAHGFFENCEPLTELTRADLFQRAGERTPAFVRFSTVAGNKGSRVDQVVEGGPSVLYDAVAVVTSESGAEELAARPAARDFVTDAYAHAKFVGYTAAAALLFRAGGLDTGADGGFVELAGATQVAELFRCCHALRYWPRTTRAGS